MVTHSDELLKRAGGKLPEALTQHQKNVKRYKRMARLNGKLTNEQVREIRWTWSMHLVQPTQKSLARYYHVKQSAISDVVNYKTHKHVIGKPKRKWIEYPE